MFRVFGRVAYATRAANGFGVLAGGVAAALVAAGALATAATAATPAAAHAQTRYVAVGLSASNGYDVAAKVTAAGGHVIANYPVADAASVSLPAGTSVPGVALLPDVAMHLDAATDPSAQTTQSVQTVRQTVDVPSGVDGHGVTVALVDTGVADSSDLAGRVTHLNVSGAPTGDGYGHGTFMAGLIAGDGAMSDGAYAGVATATRILDVQVAAADGSTSLTRVLAGVQAVAFAHIADPSVRVLNLSLSSGSSLPAAFDPLARALNALWREGVTAVVAAGNDGPAAGTVTSPGDDPTVITVGSLDENVTADRSDDVVSDYSSRGPTASGDAKPDLVAPGAHVVSLRDPGSVIDTGFPSARVGDGYFRGSGTSMSTAVVSGLVADLLSVRPGLSPDDVKQLLTASAYQAPGLTDPTAAGAGGADLDAALSGAVPATRPEHNHADVPNGPKEKDAATWAAFADAWQRGDFAAAARTWAALSPASRSWAGRAWAAELWAEASLSNDPTLLGRAWAARMWAADGWLGRAWAARTWAATDWAGRAWAGRSWSARLWSGRSWAQADWSSRSWAVSAWSSRSWAGRAWVGDLWGQ